MSVNVRDFIRFGVIAVALMASLSQSRATTYYVDYANGSDASNGTSTSTPWQHCPGDPTATNTPASTSLNPGDTVHYKGGVNYVLAAPYKSIADGGTGGIALNWNGTPGSPITYDGNSSGTWGNGRAILTDNYSTNQVNAFYKQPYGSINDIVFNNLEIGPIGGSATLPPDPGGTNYSPNGIPPNPGAGIRGYGSFNNVTIANCYFHNIGYWFNAKPMGFGSVSGEAIECVDSQNLTVTNCEFTKVRISIGITIVSLTTNLAIVNCNFHDYLVWSIDLAVTATNAYMDNINIHGNMFTDFDKWYSSGFWSGYGEAPHQDGAVFRGESVTEFLTPPGNFICGTNINFYDNVFRDTFGGGGGSCALNVSGGVSGNVYNNLFVGCLEPNGTVSYQSPPPNQNFLFQVYNNTFYQWGSAAIYLDGSVNSGVFFWPVTNTVQVVIKNNIFTDGNPDAYMGLILWDSTNVPISQFTIDYNIYFTANYTMLPSTGSDLTNVGTLAGIQAHGWEQHGKAANPLFVNTSYTNGVQDNLDDFRLASSNSPAIGAGVNLISLGLPGLNYDKDGQSRSPSGPWTIGAYEAINRPLGPYVALVASSTAITNGQSVTLTWTSVNATNLTLSGFGSIALNGSTNVLPTQITTYIATAIGTNGTFLASVSVTNLPGTIVLRRVQ